MAQSAWSQSPAEKYDLTFLDPVAGGPNDIGVMLLRDAKESAEWTGDQQGAISSEQFQHVPLAYSWKNGGAGAGFSKRSPAITAATKGGALTATGYSYGEWVTSVTPEILMPSGALSTITTPGGIGNSNIVDGISYGGNYYLTTSGRYLIKIAGENGAASAIDLGVGYTCTSVVVFKGYLWISGQGSGTIRRYDGTTLTNGAAGTERSRLAVVNWTISPQIATGGAAGAGGFNAERMVATGTTGVTFQHIADTADPLVSADWSSATKIGDGASYTTQWIVANNHTVWFATNGGVVACDETGYTPNLTQWMTLHYNASNGGQAVYFNGVVWYAHESGLVAVPVTGERQDLAERWAQFGFLQPNQTPIYGRPRVIAPGGDCLWVGYYSVQTDTSYVMRLIFERDGSIRWSGAEAVFVGEAISLIRRVSPASGVPYLLISTAPTVPAAPKMYRQELPVSGNPYVDYINATGYTSAGTSVLYAPREDGESTSRKVAEDYTVVSKNLGGNNSISVYASIDDAAYALQGTARRSGRSRFPAPATQAGGVNWNWKLTMNCDATLPWVLESFGVGLAVIPDDQTVRTYKVIVYAEQELNKESTERSDPDRKWNQIRALRKRDRVRVRDQWRRVRSARVLQAIQHTAYWDSVRKTWVMVCTITVRFLYEPARYSAGYAYNSGACYGASA